MDISQSFEIRAKSRDKDIPPPLLIEPLPDRLVSQEFLKTSKKNLLKSCVLDPRNVESNLDNLLQKFSPGDGSNGFKAFLYNVTLEQQKVNQIRKVGVGLDQLKQKLDLVGRQAVYIVYDNEDGLFQRFEGAGKILLNIRQITITSFRLCS